MSSISTSAATNQEDPKASTMHIEHANTTVRTPEDLSAQWLSSILKADVATFKATQIGTGQVSCCYRVELRYNPGSTPGPASVVLKVASTDESSRSSAKILGLYLREVMFYAEAASRIAPGAAAKVYHSSYDKEDDTCCIVLEDFSPCTAGDDIKSCNLEQARLSMQTLGKIHRPFIGNAEFQGKPWLNLQSQLPAAMFEAIGKEFLERYDARIKEEHKQILKRFFAGYETYHKTQTTIFDPLGVVHADYRMDNILFKQDNLDQFTSATAVDWQTILWGPIMMDVSYFLGCALTTENRRAWQDELLSVYYEALGPDPGFAMEQCTESLRLHTYFGVLMAVVSPMLVQRTDRGDDLFMVLIDRHCNHVIDRNALALLPDPVKQVPLKPLAEDDSKTHEPGSDKLWQESWYFDFADPQQGIGGYVRLGVDPARKRSWYTATLCGPSRPTIAIVDFGAPLPDEKLTIHAENFTAEQGCLDPMKEYRVAMSAPKAEVYEDPSELLEGKPGKPITASMDLVWKTDGEPYAYRLATRYEIPCRVSGTLKIGDEVIEVSSCLGQRDHSWGSRDWWAMDWVWNATHLDDGTHIHSLDLRIPKAPRMACGYVQGPQQEITEIETCIVEETFEKNGLPVTTPTNIKLDGGQTIKLDMKMMGHGPLRLTSDEGKVDMFPRAWGTVKTEDGRTGVAWMEWNRNTY